MTGLEPAIAFERTYTQAHTHASRAPVGRGVTVTVYSQGGSTALPAASARGGGTPNTIAAALTAPSTARRDSTCGCGEEEEAVVSERVVIRTGTLRSVVVRC